jgi:4-amino-4-deoxy-L-arabinose transferase-like glycosyltransferase
MKRDTVIAIGVGFIVLVTLVATATEGYVRDEGYYFKAARDYHAWFLHPSFDDAVLTRDFGYNTEHPGFVKILAGFTAALVPGALGYRLASMLIVAVGAVFTFFYGLRLFGRWTGLLAVALLFTMPHVFYHSHLACFDAPLMALSVIATYCFWRACDERRWVVPAAVTWGLALATKHNAVFVLAGFVLATLLARAAQFAFRERRLTIPALPVALLVTPVIGLIVLYVFYPYGWHHPLERLNAYYAYHMQHEHYPVDFFGTLYTAPPFPWGYAFRMTALTVPLTTLTLGILGLVTIARRRRDLGAVLLLVGALVPPLVISFPTVPIFGGTKHWMAMMPFFCIAAASVVVRYRILLSIALIALPLFETVRVNPHGQTYFNELVMGHQGAAALGLPRTFWGGDARDLLPYLNAHAEQGALVYTGRMNQLDWEQYQSDGLARADLQFTTDLRAARWAFVWHQREHQGVEYSLWDRVTKPEAEIGFDGVPLVSLYRLPAP